MSDPPHDGPGHASRLLRHRRLRLLVFVGAGLALLAVLLLPRASGEGTSSQRKQAPNFELATVEDPQRTVSLAQFRGMPVVLNFWASWCVPCRKEMPAFQAVAERVDGRVAFLGVNHEDGRRGARTLLDDTGVRYPSAYDPEGSVARSYGLFGMPTTVFIMPDGRIAKKHTGQLSRSELEDAIREVFALTVP